MVLNRRKFISSAVFGAAAVSVLAACGEKLSPEEEAARASAAASAASAAADSLNSRDPLVHADTPQKEIAEDAANGLQSIFTVARTQAGDDPSSMFARANDNIRLQWNKALVKASDDALKNFSPGGSRVDWLNDLSKQEGFDFAAFVKTVEENTIFRDAAFYAESMTEPEKTAFNMYWATEANYAFGKSRALTARYGTTVFLAEPTFSEPGDVTVIDENTVDVKNFTSKVVPDGTAVPLERTRSSWVPFKMVKTEGTWRIDAKSYLESCESRVKSSGADFPLDFRVGRDGVVRDGAGNEKAKLNLG